MSYRLIYPEYFNDNLVQFEVEAKGYLYNVVLSIDNVNNYELCFYDSVRLSQNLEVVKNSLAKYFYEPNLIVLEKVNKENIENVISDLVSKEHYKLMVPG